MSTYIKIFFALIAMGICYYMFYANSFNNLSKRLLNDDTLQNGNIDLLPIENKDLLLLDGMEDFVNITLTGYSTLDTAKQVQAYVRFNTNYKHEVILKGFDKKGIEICRSAYSLSGNKNESMYPNFIFDIAAPVNIVTYFSIEQVKQQ